SAHLHPHSFPTRRSSDLPRVAHEAELGGEEHRIAPAGERAPDELLVGVGTIHVRGVEEIQAELECPMDGCDRFGVVVRAVELARSEEHTSELQSLAYLVC